MVSIMKLWTPLHMTCLCMALLSVLGAFKDKPVIGDEILLVECWGYPTINDCTKKCSKTFKCINEEQTCCWTYCGNICWKTPVSWEMCA
ncbi:PREDICTED: protein WFDC11 [Hipposideros armiger]|uniref:Protein WFDC11 n=1 Tax=Hipposideros armiger TaxID=186990 RepID=A0A8B7QXE4_HIPAR|nr:PREDICTED: protein WFDC11 [Hipposideros armiger]